jgi:DNA-binding transcriptional ArsR family regulator
MVKYSDTALNRVFAALADPTRRAIVARLAKGEASVGDLGAPFDVSAPAITKHLKVLEAAGMLRRTRDGRVHRCRLEAQPIADAATWIEAHRRIWKQQLDRLAEYLERTSLKEGRHDDPDRRPPRRG